jgi:cysteine desulfurase
MAANNEVGTIEPFGEIGQLARQQGILFHTDAVQAYGKIPIDVQKDHIDFLSVSAHKIYGPKGVGFFYQRKGVELVPLVHGGGQEHDLRLIFERSGEKKRLRDLTDQLWNGLKAACPDVKLNGPKDANQRVPGLLHITFPGITGEQLVQLLDHQGFATSSGAACAAGSAPPSHVLLGMGHSEAEGKQGLRISFGHSTTPEQVEQLIKVLPGVVAKLKTPVSFSDD